MGLSGSDVAKEAADMILMDDDVGTITAAIEEGKVSRAASYICAVTPSHVFQRDYSRVPLNTFGMGIQRTLQRHYRKRVLSPRQDTIEDFVSCFSCDQRPSVFVYQLIPVFSGHFLQYQELSDVSALHGRGSTVHRSLGNIHGLQVPHQRNAGTPSLGTLFSMVMGVAALRVFLL